MDALRDEASADLLGHFQDMIREYVSKFGIPWEKPWTREIDDKWLFHAAYLKDVANEVGLELSSITPTLGLNTIFTDMVRGTLGLTGLPMSEVPEQTWTILQEFNEGVSLPIKQRLTPEGIICLTKP